MANRDAALRYAEIKMEISRLEDEIKMIKPEALGFILEAKGDSDQPVSLKELPAGYNFTVRPGKKKWKYSPTTTALLEGAEKAAEAEEKLRLQQDKGPATFEESDPILVFNSPKV